MIFMLVPFGNAEWEDIRLFTTYSSMEQVMVKTAKKRVEQNMEPQWCFGVAYDGNDELQVVWNYHITHDCRIDRKSP